MGRPTSYKREYAARALKYCLLGATDVQLAEAFGVSEKTLNNWKSAHPEFLQSLKEGKAEADATIANALFERAKGFEYEKAVPIKLKEVIYENGKRVKETERVEVVMVHEVVPPDTTAGIFWLKNRRPDVWRDKQDVEHTGKNGGPMEVQVWQIGEKLVTF